MCLPLSTADPNAHFHELYYEGYATGDHPNVVRFRFLQLAVTTWRIHEIVRRTRHYSHIIESPEMSYIVIDFRNT
jgi:hypothetical protein